MKDNVVSLSGKLAEKKIDDLFKCFSFVKDDCGCKICIKDNSVEVLLCDEHKFKNSLAALEHVNQLCEKAIQDFRENGPCR